ncbi:MAG: transporter, ATP-binding protein [Labilithrix sp.]|nr:transporter, ATP-binding protein [Labilithrix sp.]
MTDDVTPAIAARGIRVARGDQMILRGVTMHANPGEVVGVLGPSGAGKSTLFRALVGEIPVEDGTVLLGGRDVTNDALWERARAGVAYVSQTPSVLWDLTVRDNLRVYQQVVRGTATWWPRPAAARLAEDREVAQLAERVQLQDRLDVRAGELSGGERRRLELARGLARPPRVLVCDEPFAGVDPQSATRLGDMLQKLAVDEQVAVLLSDHHVAEALRVCTRAILVLDGQIAMEGAPGEFEQHPLVVGRYLGNWGRSLPPPAPAER